MSALPSFYFPIVEDEEIIVVEFCFYFLLKFNLSAILESFKCIYFSSFLVSAINFSYTYLQANFDTWNEKYVHYMQRREGSA